MPLPYFYHTQQQVWLSKLPNNERKPASTFRALQNIMPMSLWKRHTVRIITRTSTLARWYSNKHVHGKPHSVQTQKFKQNLKLTNCRSSNWKKLLPPLTLTLWYAWRKCLVRRMSWMFATRWIHFFYACDMLPLSDFHTTSDKMCGHAHTFLDYLHCTQTYTIRSLGQSTKHL